MLYVYIVILIFFSIVEDIEPRFVCSLVPSVLNTIEMHTYYDKLKIKVTIIHVHCTLNLHV